MKGTKVSAIALSGIILAALGVAVGMAQGPAGVWTSWPFIQNMESEEAVCVVEFYAEDATGTAPLHTIGDFTIPADESKLVPVWSESGLGSSFSGSMVVSCDREVAAVTNVVNSQGAGSSYVGASSGADEVSIPSVHADDWGWFTEISVQNVSGSEDAEVTISFTASERGQDYTPPSVTVKPYAVHRFDTSSFVAQMDNVSGVAGFVGGASISTTGGSLVAVAREYNAGAGSMTIAYNGIPSTDGGTTVYFPSQHNNNWNWNSWNFVFNSWGTDAEIGIEFSGKSVVTGTVPANGSLTIATMDYLGTEDYVGALTISCTNCPPGSNYISGMCNEVNGVTLGAISYNGFYTGTTAVLMPSQHNANWGWNSFNFVQNLSGETANVDVEWVASGDSVSPAPAPFSTTIPANGKLDLFTYAYHGADDFVGSLRITSTNDKPLVAICNEVNGLVTGLDASISYNALPDS